MSDLDDDLDKILADAESFDGAISRVEEALKVEGYYEIPEFKVFEEFLAVDYTDIAHYHLMEGATEKEALKKAKDAGDVLKRRRVSRKISDTILEDTGGSVGGMVNVVLHYFGFKALNKTMGIRTGEQYLELLDSGRQVLEDDKNFKHYLRNVWHGVSGLPKTRVSGEYKKLGG